MSQWFTRGADGARDQIQAQETNRMLQIRRYLLLEGRNGVVIPVEDLTFNVSEHKWATPGKTKPDWRNVATCVAGISECAYCIKLGRQGGPSFLLTSIDTTGWVNSDGAVMGQGEIQILPLNASSFPKWARLGIRPGSKVEMNRDKEDPPTGLPGRVAPPRSETWQTDYFPSVTFQGKPLSELWAKADADPKFRAALSKVFNLESGPDGKLLRKVPTFNFAVICEPLPIEKARAHVSTAILTAAKGGKAAKGGGRGGFGDDSFGSGPTSNPFGDDASGGTTEPAVSAPIPEDDIPF